MSYQLPKAKDFGVNLFEGCLQKQLIIDRQQQEILALKKKLKLNEKRLKDGFFGSSTPSSQLPLKANSLTENQAKRGKAAVNYLVEQIGKCIKSGFKVNPHMLRHSTSYYLANKGCDTRLIQDYFGHRNITHTVRYTRTSAHRFEGLWP